jgi:hypothetical protein
MRLYSRGIVCPKFCKNALPAEKQRAQGRPGARCTRGLACMLHKKMRTRAYRFSGEHPAFPAQWLYGLYGLAPVNGLCCHRHSQSAFAARELDASVAASGPHDFAVRICRTRLSQHPRPSLACPSLATMAYAPPAGQDGDSYKFDLPDDGSDLFLIPGLDIISDNQN